VIEHSPYWYSAIAEWSARISDRHNAAAAAAAIIAALAMVIFLDALNRSHWLRASAGLMLAAVACTLAQIAAFAG
jgi:hypothetical protein